MSLETMSVEEFRKQGYLQEVNRRFLHPLGIALSVKTEGAGPEIFTEIWDYRDDPEGVLFGDRILEDQAAKEKALRVNTELAKKAKVRMETYGRVVQPIPGVDDFILT